MKKKQTRTATTKRTANGKGRKVHALHGDRPDGCAVRSGRTAAPTSGSERGARQAAQDTVEKIANRILSLWYHCAEAVYHIGNTDTRFSFESMYAQELTRLRNEGISETDIEQGGKLSVLIFKKIEAEHETQIEAWETCFNELRTFLKLFNAIQAETPDELKKALTNIAVITASERIRNIKEPKPLLCPWFMDDIYRTKTRDIKTMLATAFDNAIISIGLLIDRIEEQRDERENNDLQIIRYARENGIEVNISGASFENAVKFWNDTGRIAHEGFNGIPQELFNKEIGAELSRRIEQVENGIKGITRKYADISNQLPDELNLQRAIEQAEKQGPLAKAYAENAEKILRELSTLRGEELREHQRNRAAQVILAKSLTLGEGARYHADKLMEETKRGGYGADGHRDTPDLQKVIQSLEQGLRKYADKLGIAGQINKGKRGRRKAAKIGPDGSSPSR